MYIFLSSGSRPQYRDDVIRSLALPAGSSLQFRYDKQYLAHAALDDIENNRMNGNVALIVYIDQSTPDQSPSFVPCRYATIAKTAEHGTTVSVELTVAEYAYSDDVAAFATWLSNECPNDAPALQNGQVTGKYLLKPARPPVNPVRTANLRNWEKIVAQIAGRPDFANVGCFFVVRELAKNGKAVVAVNGTFPLGSGSFYEMRIYHYHPSSFVDRLSLELSVADDCGISMLTNPTIRIDSRYDQKCARFKTNRTPVTQNGFLTVSQKNGDNETWLFDLPVEVKGSLCLSLLFACALASFLAGPQIYSAWSNANLAPERAFWSIVVSAICGLLAGGFAVFGLRKSW